VLVNGHMDVIGVGEWIYGGTVCLVNGHMEILCVLVNGHLEVLCGLVNGHMEVMWCW